MCAMLPLTQVLRGGGRRERQGPQTERDRDCTVALGLAKSTRKEKRKRKSGWKTFTASTLQAIFSHTKLSSRLLPQQHSGLPAKS